MSYTRAIVEVAWTRHCSSSWRRPGSIFHAVERRVPRNRRTGAFMDQDLRDVVGNVLQNNLAVLGAFIALSSSLDEEQQQKLLESLDTMKKANQALLEMLQTH